MKNLLLPTFSALLLAFVLLDSPASLACGGLFCQIVPINQAGEQIIFHQEGNDITALVQIQYIGEAENFSWVLPVPGIPSIDVGSDLLFSSLEPATRPQFNLTTQGEACPSDTGGSAAAPNSPAPVASEADGQVTILKTVAVGPFDAKVVTSEDPDALKRWLANNNFDLTRQGETLLASYIKDGMNFVVLKLQQGLGIGDIQPIMLRYQSSQPMIPIRLTAVAAEPNMGIIVWFLGDARAVPVNYFHVVPNYTLLNWYAGSRNAYVSYQQLITDAMNEAGGQGFATDFAGRDPDLLQRLPNVENYENALNALTVLDDDAAFISTLFQNSIFPASKTLELLNRELPLPAGFSSTVYTSNLQLKTLFSQNELSAARVVITKELPAAIIQPLVTSLALFENNPYLTRLYTTLSPEEMSLDPLFSFNYDLDPQQRARNATLDAQCTANGTEWTLTLGKGTQRNGEAVILGKGEPPVFSTPTISQDALWRKENVSDSGSATVVEQKTFVIAEVSSSSSPLTTTSTQASSGGGIFHPLLLLFLVLKISRKPLCRACS